MFFNNDFMTWFNELNEKRKKEILRDIFETADVSTYSISNREDRIVFQLYSEKIFYQFVFMKDNSLYDEFYVRVSSSQRFVICQIYIGRDFSWEKLVWIYELRKIFGVQDEEGEKIFLKMFSLF